MEEFRVLMVQKGRLKREDGHVVTPQHHLESKEFGPEGDEDKDRESMLRAFIINRFLPAAKAVTAGGRHESSVTSSSPAFAASTRQSPGKNSKKKKTPFPFANPKLVLQQSAYNDASRSRSLPSPPGKKFQDVCSGHAQEQTVLAPRELICMEEHNLSSVRWKGDAANGDHHDSKECLVPQEYADVRHAKEREPSTLKEKERTAVTPESLARSSTAATLYLSSSSSSGDWPPPSLTALDNVRSGQFRKSDDDRRVYSAVRYARRDATGFGNVSPSSKPQRTTKIVENCNLGEQEKRRMHGKRFECSVKTVMISDNEEEDNDDDDEATFYDASCKLNPSQSAVHCDACDPPRSSVDWESDLGGTVSHGVGISESSESAPRRDCRPAAGGCERCCHVGGFIKSNGSTSLRKRFGKSLTLDTVGSILLLSADHTHEDDEGEEEEDHELRSSTRSRTPRTHISHHSFRNSPACSSSRSFVPPIFPPKCQSHDVGWPFGISDCRLDTRHESRQTEKQASSVVPSPPLPPSPSRGSWLEKAIALSASRASPLCSLRQNEQKVLFSRKKLDFKQPTEKVLEASEYGSSERRCVPINKGKTNDCNQTATATGRKNWDSTWFHRTKLPLSVNRLNHQWKLRSSSTKEETLDLVASIDKTMVDEVKQAPVTGLQKRVDRRSARKKLEFAAVVEDVVEVKWEDIVKRGRKKRNPVQEDHLLPAASFQVLGPFPN